MGQRIPMRACEFRWRVRWAHVAPLFAIFLSVVFSLACALALASAPVASAAGARPAQAVAQADVQQPHVTILVLDMSGSMSSSDPDGLRCSAANAYISLSAPGQFIGVVGLVDPTNAGKSAVWAQPTEMATQAARDQLIQTIATKSNNCAPNGNTPTQDALTKALQMLEATVTQGRTGSVILLTDGVPAPNPDQQQKAITQTLVPQFEQHGYVIDTIALGDDPSVRPFLRDIASGTNGIAYDDVNPTTHQPDPLRIAPFFLDIFGNLTKRTPKQLVDQQQLTPPTTARDFYVSNLDSSLDVVVIKQDASAHVALQSPEGVVYRTSSASVLVAQDPHYAIFSINNPTSGEWIATVSGGSSSTRFSVYGLAVTDLAINLTAPVSNQHYFPIDQPLPVTAELTSNSVDVTGGHFTVRGEVQNGDKTVQTVLLTPVNGGSSYQGTITPLKGDSPGAYALMLTVTQGSGDVLASVTRAIRFEVFPTPFLLSQGQPAHAVTTDVVAFDPVLQALYSAPIVSWFAGLPLNNIPARPSATLPGVVMVNGKFYQDARVTGVAQKAGSTANATATVSDTAPGKFQVIFPAATSGTYNLKLVTIGNYIDSHGAFETTPMTVALVVKPATGAQEARAWSVSVAYLLFLICLSPLFYRWFPPRVGGAWERSGGGQPAQKGSFDRYRGRINWSRWWFFPHRRSSSEVLGFPGLEMRWRFNGTTEVRSNSKGAWTNQNNPVTGSWVTRGNPLVYKPKQVTFTVSAGGGRRSGSKPTVGSGWGQKPKPSAGGWGQPKANAGGWGQSKPKSSGGGGGWGQPKSSGGGGGWGQSKPKSGNGWNR